MLRISKEGNALFYVRPTRPDGRKAFCKLGLWPGLSLRQACTEARVTIGEIQRGADPTAEKRAARELQARKDAMPTLGELAQIWAIAAKRDTGVTYRSEVIRIVARCCGGGAQKRGRRSTDAERAAALKRGLAEKRVNEIDDRDVATVIQAARERGDGEARHLVRALRRLFRFAIAHGYVDASPVERWMYRESGGRRGIPWMKDRERERVLTDLEVVRLWAASAGLDPSARAFARLLLLTGCRSAEISGLSWREVERGPAADAAASMVAINLTPTRTKNRRGHRVPLGELAAAELQSLAAASDPVPLTGLVFRGVASRVAGICRALRSEMGVDDWTWHDLRRTAATGMARLGCPREHVEAALNHISARGGLVGIYQRHSFTQEAGAALEAWQTHVASLVPSAPEVVAPIMRTRRPSPVVGLPARRRTGDVRVA